MFNHFDQDLIIKIPIRPLPALKNENGTDMTKLCHLILQAILQKYVKCKIQIFSLLRDVKIEHFNLKCFILVLISLDRNINCRYTLDPISLSGYCKNRTIYVLMQTYTHVQNIKVLMIKVECKGLYVT